MSLSAAIAGRRRLGTHTVVAVVAVAVTVFSQGRASASCGDYLTVHHAETSGATDEQFLTITHHPAAPLNCPDCSDRRPTPFTPPPSVSPTSDGKVCLVSVSTLEAFEFGARVVPTTCPRPVHRPVPIYHPPRD